MTQIITVTPNPAIDVSTAVSTIAPFSKLRCAPAQRDPGGGGINVARVIKRLGGDVRAIYPAGGSAGQLLRHLMDAEEVQSLAIQASEETREDFTVFEETTKQQYRFVLPGARLTEDEWQECLKALALIQPCPAFIVASGSLPPGAPDDFFGRLARSAKLMNARMIVDTSGPPLKAALLQGVYLIKPNLKEFKELTGVTEVGDSTLVEAARSLIHRYHVQIVALTLGDAGALLITLDDAIRAEGLRIEPVSVVGAGDSFLGAMIWSLANGDHLESAFRFGVAAGIGSPSELRNGPLPRRRRSPAFSIGRDQKVPRRFGRMRSSGVNGEFRPVAVHARRYLLPGHYECAPVLQLIR